MKEIRNFVTPYKMPPQQEQLRGRAASTILCQCSLHTQERERERERERETVYYQRNLGYPLGSTRTGRIWSGGGFRLLCRRRARIQSPPSSSQRVCSFLLLLLSHKIGGPRSDGASRISLSGKRTAALQRCPKALHQEREIECSIPRTVHL